MENEMFVNQLKPSGWKLQNQAAVKLKLDANMVFMFSMVVLLGYLMLYCLI